MQKKSCAKKAFALCDMQFIIGQNYGIHNISDNDAAFIDILTELCTDFDPNITKLNGLVVCT